MKNTYIRHFHLNLSSNKPVAAGAVPAGDRVRIGEVADNSRIVVADRRTRDGADLQPVAAACTAAIDGGLLEEREP